jgi:hypothetical protein
MYRSFKSSSGRLRASLFAVALLTPLAVATTHAQNRRAVPRDSQVYNQAYNSQAYNTGYDRGSRAGADDGQRNRDFNFVNKSDYRSADAGYRREYGDRERWRSDFRLGFESGYRDGYSRYRPTYGNGGYGNGGVNDPYGNSNGGWRPGTGGPPPWANGRGRGRGGYQTNDPAFQTGFTDGYEAGLDDGRDRRRFDPVGEGRYRSGDHGYNGNYGTRDAYKLRYRDAFREGYEDGYGDGQRYDNRSTRSDGRPSRWPW